MFISTVLVLASGVAVLGQRPSFAGSKPIGYPDLYDLTTTTQANGLGNRFGEGDGTTQRLPLEVNGDKALFDRLSKLPIDKQPFWLLNWKVLEEQRKKPQTYPQRPSPFNDPPQTGNANPPGPILNNGGVPLTSEIGNRNGISDSTNRPDPGYHYPDLFSPTKVEDSKIDDSGFSNPNYNGGALSFTSSTTRRPQPPKRAPARPLTILQPSKPVPNVGNRNSNDEVKETSSSGTFSATNAFQNGNSVFSNFNSVVKKTVNVDPQGNMVVVQTSGAPGPDAPFQLTNKGVLVPNPAVMNTASVPSLPNIPNFDPTMFNQAGIPTSSGGTKYYTTSSGGSGMNSSLVNSNAGFHNTNSVRKNATHYNSSYQNTYHYSYSYQNKYVIPHGGGAPVKVDSQSSGFPVQNGGLPNSNVQFVSSTSPNANVQSIQSNANNQQRVVQTSRSPPVTHIVTNPNRRQVNSDYSYYDYN